MNTDDWFRSAAFGLFVHFDHASPQGIEISWPLVRGMPVADYHRSAETFDPTSWDPTAMAKLAADAGMRYAVFTAKHHSGWAAWPSRVAPFNISTSRYGHRGGDLVGEFVEATRCAGLKVGLYFSLADWSHPDYPAFTDDMRPYCGAEYPRSDQTAWARFRSVLQGELSELLTAYGPVDLLWFDGQWERTAAEWGSADIAAHIRSLNPRIVFNNRLPEAGGYATPEQIVPGRPPSGLWEACMTMNDTWAWSPTDTNYKSDTELISALVETVAGGGNLLLNISPQGDGSLPEPQTARLHAIAAWMRSNGESILDTEPGLQPWQFYGPSTRRGNVLYLHLLARPAEYVAVRGLPARQLNSARFLGTHTALPATLQLGAGADESPNTRGNIHIDIRHRIPPGPVPVLRLDFDTDAALD